MAPNGVPKRPQLAPNWGSQKAPNGPFGGPKRPQKGVPTPPGGSKSPQKPDFGAPEPKKAVFCDPPP